jgi:hypothetical protein
MRLKMPSLQTSSLVETKQMPKLIQIPITNQITEQRTRTRYQQITTQVPSMGFGTGFNIPVIPIIGLPSMSFDLGLGGSTKRKGKRKKSKVAPSFTAIAFNLKGAFPKSGKFGISPINLRYLPKKSKPFKLAI